MRKEWLFWNLRSMPLPPLIVTGNPNLPGAGIPGSGNVIPLVGPQQNLGMFDGARLTIGRWLDPDGELGGEVSGFIFVRKSSTNIFQGSPSLPLSVPTISSTGTPFTYDYSFPGRFVGALGLTTATQFLGAEGNLLHRVYDKNGVSLDGLLGYRYLWLNERLDLLGETQSAGAIGTFQGMPLPNGTTVFTTDTFKANTQFHGAQMGGRLQFRRDMFTITTFGKYGLGINLETLNTYGATTANGPGGIQTVPGGVRVLPSNLSASTHDQFSMMGEAGIELGLQLTSHINIRVGYNLLWWSSVLRPGSVASPVVTRSQVPIDPTFSTTPVANALPTTAFHTSDFLAHGLSVGAVFGW